MAPKGQKCPFKKRPQKEGIKMNGFIQWFNSKSRLKRWMLLILIGIALVCYGTAEILVLKEISFTELAKIIITFVLGVLAVVIQKTNQVQHQILQ